MIVREFYRTRSDGVNLYKIYSDKTKYILQEDTGLVYNSVIDAELRIRTSDLEAAVMELAELLTEGE